MPQGGIRTAYTGPPARKLATRGPASRPQGAT